MNQLDIFVNSRNVVLRNDALAAVLQYDGISANHLMQAPGGEYPDDTHGPAANRSPQDC
ncbi:hypothetical protein [Paraburkholderia sp. Ac-20347]|uniref:hypothetical protein n=1 Tax=Paraburkholderia sp. Ac-20347 TaxID=2703892 RepID=UPI00197DB417|nr:hypothetical protein [Paraburkholderia sp. Ac-20347]MBN3807662.1 hypothetical protein [Paraburkholderia sp. Ac-20347]